MRHASSVLGLCGLMLLLAACGPSYRGTFVDPSGSAWVSINDNGDIVNAMGDHFSYVVKEGVVKEGVVKEGKQDGTVLEVTDGAAWHATWRVSADGKELYGASSPANVVFRRK